VAINLSSYSEITLSFWLYWNSWANSDALAGEYSTNYNSSNGGFILDANNSSPDGGTFIISLHNTGGYTAAEFTRPSAAAWHHYLVQFNIGSTGSGQIPAIYVDGVTQSLTYPETAGTSGSFGNYTFYFMSRDGSSLFGAGQMANVAIWGGVLLNTNEALALAMGRFPIKSASNRSFFCAP
jgi:hypothetical protein